MSWCQPISKSEFKNRKKVNKLLGVQGDKENHRILSVRQNQGTIENRGHLNAVLSEATNSKIDATKPLIIIYYPGKDQCNSSIPGSRKSKNNYWNELEKGVHKIKEANILYVYKDDTGLYKKFDGHKNWIKDPEQTIEKLFFKRHYPCNSFVVISEKNTFVSYFGEFSKEQVWKAVEVLKDK